jgi:cytosine/creatinine deaminase
MEPEATRIQLVRNRNGICCRRTRRLAYDPVIAEKFGYPGAIGIVSQERHGAMNDLYERMLKVAIQEARYGLVEGGIPIGAAMFRANGELVSGGHNRRVQQGDPSMHAETDAFRRAGRQRSYKDLVMVTTLAPCWYCSGLIRQFRIRTVVIGESRTFAGGVAWLREHGVEVIDMDNAECREMLEKFIAEHPEIWNEDIGEG